MTPTKQHSLNQPYLEVDDNGASRIIYTVSYGQLAGRQVAIPITLEQSPDDIATERVSRYIVMKYGTETLEPFISHLKDHYLPMTMFFDIANDTVNRDTLHKEYTRWTRM